MIIDLKMNLSKLFMKITKEMGNNHFFGIPGSGVPLDLMDSGKNLGIMTGGLDSMGIRRIEALTNKAAFSYLSKRSQICLLYTSPSPRD